MQLTEKLHAYGSVLPCGGKGTRLQTLTEDRVPKSLFSVGGKELIRYSTDALTPHVVHHVVFAIDHHAQKIRDWVETAKLPHVIEFSEQTEPGILGALSAGIQRVPEDELIACNTDEVRVNLDLDAVIDFHQRVDTLATMVATYADRLYRHRLLMVRPDGRVIYTRLKPDEYKDEPEAKGLVNTGLLVLDKRVTDYFNPARSTDWSGLIDPLCEAGQLSAYINPNIAYFNVGTPAEYQEAETFLKNYSK